MQTKNKIIIVAVSLLFAFALGRWAAPTKVKTEVKTVYVQKKQENTHQNDHTKTVIVQKPDGSKVTTITQNDSTDTESSSTTSNTSQRDKEVDRSAAKVSVLALGGVQLNEGGLPVYGLSISKPILGPITTGVWGLSSGVVGASVGLTF